jgi:plastocyanin
MRTVVLAAAAVLALAVTGASQPASTATKAVAIKAAGFQPATVTIATGDAVKWTNRDTKTHQVVANNGSFASAVIRPGNGYTHVFRSAGTFRYHDALHPALTGKVVVKGPPPAVTIGAALPILVYGQSTHVSGVVSSGKADETVTIWAQPYGQASYAQLATLKTTTNGVWDLVVKPTLLTNYTARCLLLGLEALRLGEGQEQPLPGGPQGLPPEVHALPPVGEGRAGDPRPQLAQALPLAAQARPLRAPGLHVPEPGRRRLPGRLQSHRYLPAQVTSEARGAG